MVFERYLPLVEQGEGSEVGFDTGKGRHREMRSLTHRTIAYVTRDIEEFAFNTAVSFIMELVNGIYHYVSEPEVDLEILREAVTAVLSLLAPFAPFLSEELWSVLDLEGSVHAAAWPGFDEELAKPEEVTLVVQVNGKVRDKLTVPADIADDDMRERALACENTRKFIADKHIRKVIIVPGKLVNIVV
jgi:leucyl-tRNA synthetase